MDLSALNIEQNSEIITTVTFWGMRILTAIAILIAGWVIGKWASNGVKNIKNLDDTLKSFLGGLIKYAILAIAVIAVLGQLGVQTASLLAVLGAAGLAIGLALQGTLSNVASGVMLLVLRPFNVGDYIEAGNIAGTVKTLSLFMTELATSDNVQIIVPNSQIANSEIFNFSRNKQRRIDLVNGISYNDDIDKVIKVIQQTVEADKRIINTKSKEPTYFVSALGDSAINITSRFWVNSGDYWAVKWDLTKTTKEALDKNGITIPFPTQTLDITSEAAEAIGKAA